MQALMKMHDGVYPSTVHVNNRPKLRWRCAEGHGWEVRPMNTKDGAKRGHRNRVRWAE